MVRSLKTTALVAVLMVLLPLALTAQDDLPSELQLEFGGYLAAPSSSSFSWFPVPEEIPSSQRLFNVLVTSVDLDEDAQEALIGDILNACQQEGVPPPAELAGLVLCPSSDAVNQMFDDPEPPAAIVVEWVDGHPTSGIGFQMTLVGFDPSRPAYDGAEGDPNTGHNIGNDYVILPEGPTNAVTEFSDGEFDFRVGQGAIIIDTPDWTAFIVSGLALSGLDDVEMWVDQDGWDSAAIPGDWGGLFVGSPEFIDSIFSDDSAEEEPSPEETGSEPEDGQVTSTVGEQPPEEEPTVGAEETGQADDDGVPVGLVVAGAVAAVAAVGAGVYAATRRRKGKCDELRDRSDAAQAAWEQASREMNRARDAYAEALGSDGEAAALEAQSRAEAMEQDAYREFQRHWNNYQDCLSDELEAVHSQPPGTETRPAERIATVETATTAVATTASTAVSAGTEVEWRVEKDHYERWREPVGHVHIELDRTSDAFEEWLHENGEVEETPEWLRWLSPPLAIVSDLSSPGHEATFSLDDAEDLRSRGSLIPLLREGATKHWVTMELTIPTQTVGRHCERKWVRHDGGPWIATDDIRLGEIDEPIEDEPIYVKGDYETVESLAGELIWQLKKAEEMSRAGAQAQIELRERCGG